MRQHSEQPKPGFIRVKYELAYTSDIDLSAYGDMTIEQAIAHELDNDVENILEIIASSTEDESKLVVARDVKYVSE